MPAGGATTSSHAWWSEALHEASGIVCVAARRWDWLIEEAKKSLQLSSALLILQCEFATCHLKVFEFVTSDKLMMANN